jgi:hypothetical protein
MGWKREAEDMPPKACLVHFPSLSGPALLFVWLVFHVLLWHCFWIFSCFASARAQESSSHCFLYPDPMNCFFSIAFLQTYICVLSSSFQQHR